MTTLFIGGLGMWPVGAIDNSKYLTDCYNLGKNL